MLLLRGKIIVSSQFFSGIYKVQPSQILLFAEFFKFPFFWPHIPAKTIDMRKAFKNSKSIMQLKSVLFGTHFAQNKFFLRPTCVKKTKRQHFSPQKFTFHIFCSLTCPRERETHLTERLGLCNWRSMKMKAHSLTRMHQAAESRLSAPRESVLLLWCVAFSEKNCENRMRRGLPASSWPVFAPCRVIGLTMRKKHIVSTSTSKCSANTFTHTQSS